MRSVHLVVACGVIFPLNACAFATFRPKSNWRVYNHADDKSSTALSAHLARRNFVWSLVAGVSACGVMPARSQAEDTEDAASMFNPDGSLKKDMDTEARFRRIETVWDPSDRYMVNVDGRNAPGTVSGSKLRAAYQVPVKWTEGDGSMYLDRTQGTDVKACDHIFVYQAPSSVTEDRLEKASTIGIASALEVIDDLKPLHEADLIAARVVTKGSRRYFEFDCAVAPKSCASSKDNLGLGFCPYETIYLVSTTAVDDKLVVMVVESDKTEWKLANSDLKRVRSSFQVETTAERTVAGR